METSGIFCEHIMVGDQLLTDDFSELDSSYADTAPAFQCGLLPEPCRYATRKMKCPIYQEYLLDDTSTGG